VEPSVPTLLTDFLTRAAVTPSAPAAAAASSARAPRRQNAGSESQRSRLRSRLRIGVKRGREIITGEFRSA
jgi:hypothetical protein